MRFESADVARYYDQNTASFVAHGQGGAQGIIHRAVWGEGVSRRTEALHFVHDLLRARIAESGAQRVLDLGCGVGASLEHGLELVEDQDLTALLELDRPRDRALGLLIALTRPLASMNARLESHLGGNALRQCLKRGLITYRYRVFKASGSAK